MTNSPPLPSVSICAAKDIRRVDSAATIRVSIKFSIEYPHHKLCNQTDQSTTCIVCTLLTPIRSRLAQATAWQHLEGATCMFGAEGTVDSWGLGPTNPSQYRFCIWAYHMARKFRRYFPSFVVCKSSYNAHTALGAFRPTWYLLH